MVNRIKYDTLSPLVSLITPGWNGRKFTHRLLDSIIMQTYENMEYIFIDDGSTDGTKEIVLSYKEKFAERGISFKYVWKENGGVSTAIEEGLKYVNGEYLCWPEYDDWLTPDSVEKKVKFLMGHPDCAVVTSDAWLVKDPYLNHPYGVLSNHNKNRFDRNHFVQALLSDSVFTAACQMCRMDKFDETHPGRHIYPSSIGPNWQILLPLYYKYNRGWIEEPLCYYFIRPDSISNRNYATFGRRKKAIEEFIKAIKSTLNTIEMPEEDLAIYNDMLDEKYAKDRLLLGYQAMDKELFNIGIDYFVRKGKTVPKVFKKYMMIMNSNLLFKLVMVLRYLKHCF